MEKQIIHWQDEDAAWSMVIESGKVSIKTTGDATQADAAAALSEQWTRLMGFATGGLADKSRQFQELDQDKANRWAQEGGSK